MFLSDKITDLKSESLPLEQRKQMLEDMIESAYRELHDEFEFRKCLQDNKDSLDCKMRLWQTESAANAALKKALDGRAQLYKSVSDHFRIYVRRS